MFEDEKGEWISKFWSSLNWRWYKMNSIHLFEIWTSIWTENWKQLDSIQFGCTQYGFTACKLCKLNLFCVGWNFMKWFKMGLYHIYREMWCNVARINSQFPFEWYKESYISNVISASRQSLRLRWLLWCYTIYEQFRLLPNQKSCLHLYASTYVSWIFNVIHL